MNESNEALPQEGERDIYNPLTLNMTDEEVADAIGKRVSDGEKFWNETYDLKKNRETNFKYWNGEYYDKKSLHNHQVPYQNNRVFIAAETLIPLINSKPAQPVVIPAKNDDISRENAKNIQNVLLAKYEDQYLKTKFMEVTRHLVMGMRLGVMKYRWNNEIGLLTKDGDRTGDCWTDVLQPEKVVLDAEADNPEDVPFIGEYLNDTAEGLMYRFGDKKDQIMQELGVQNGLKFPMSKRVTYVENWFSYFDKSKQEKKEAVAWKMRNLVLDKMKNPNWNYDETELDKDGELISLNFHHRPMKPYVLFNHLNTGKYVIDDTSLMDQARIQQDIVDKRGRQIVENADQANAGIVFDKQKIKPETMAKLIGDPNEKIGVDGDVNSAVSRLPQNMLPPYVLDDRNRAEGAIDDLFGVHAPIKGGEADSPTLGQEVLSQRSDLSRTQTLATAIENGADRLYKGLVQLMKIYYDDVRDVRYTGPDGNTQFIPFSRDSIEYGVKVRVKTGSLLPDDPVSKAQETIKLAAILDPLSMGEGLSKQDPKDFGKRLMLYRMAPDQYLQEYLGQGPDDNGVDPSAQQEYEMMMAGEIVPPQQNPSKTHLATHQQQMETPEFKQADPKIQQTIIAHVEAEMRKVKEGLGQQPEDPEEQAPQTPAPEGPREFEVNNQQQPGLLSRIFGRVRGEGGDRE